MDLRFKDELVLMPDLGHQLRRLRWFRATFRSSDRASSLNPCSACFRAVMSVKVITTPSMRSSSVR